MNLAFLRAFRLRGRAISGAALLLGSLLPWQAAAAANLQDSPSSRREAPPVLEEPSFYDQWLAWRLSVGVTIASSEVRHRHVTYDKTEEHNFLGNINDMHPKDDLVFGFVARYELFPSLAIEAANDFRADLEARNKDGESCDGVLELRGWRAQVLLFWPEPSWIVRPYVGAGVEHVDATFQHTNWWHYGWPSPEEYARYGHGSTKPHHGVTRTMIVKKPGYAPTLSAGATIGISRHVQLDAYVRWTDFDDAETVFRRRDPSHSREYTMRTGAFPAEHIVYGIALKAVF